MKKVDDMKLDFSYYSGNDLKYPKSPQKPRMSSVASPTEIRAYADQIEQFEKEHEQYIQLRRTYYAETSKRLEELKEKLHEQYNVTEAQFNLLWSRAWEDGHSDGLRRVVEIFDDYYELAVDFAKLMK
jgi:hypothetical protein